MTHPTSPGAHPPADPSGMDELVAELRRFGERLAAEAVRYSRWADELAADVMPCAAELARRRAAEYEAIIRHHDRPPSKTVPTAGCVV